MTTSSTASTTSSETEATATVKSTDPQPLSNIFDTSKVPDNYAAVADLDVYDPKTGQTSATSYVVQYLGCFLVSPGRTPFIANDTVKLDDPRADGSSSGCAGFCAGRNYTLSANNNGDCFCGNIVDMDAISPNNRSLCDIPCKDDSSQTCGGGQKIDAPAAAKRRWLSARDNSYVQIISATPFSNTTIIKDGGNNTSTSSTLISITVSNSADKLFQSFSNL